jgi:hypothetical protein
MNKNKVDDCIFEASDGEFEPLSNFEALTVLLTCNNITGDRQITFSIEDQLTALEAVVGSLRRENKLRIDEIAKFKALSNHTDNDIDNYGVLLSQQLYFDCAASLTTASLYVSFLETMFTSYFEKLGRKYGKKLEGIKRDYHRWKKCQKNRWDINERSPNLGKIKTGFELAHNINLEFDDKDIQVIDALISYRNNSMHNALEWPRNKLDNFEGLDIFKKN